MPPIFSFFRIHKAFFFKLAGVFLETREYLVYVAKVFFSLVTHYPSIAQLGLTQLDFALGRQPVLLRDYVKWFKFSERCESFPIVPINVCEVVAQPHIFCSRHLSCESNETRVERKIHLHKTVDFSRDDLVKYNRHSTFSRNRGGGNDMLMRRVDSNTLMHLQM